jgi:hypothetical protein
MKFLYVVIIGFVAASIITVVYWFRLKCSAAPNTPMLAMDPTRIAILPLMIGPA